ncbi:MAG: lipid-A-disaccharide synthase [Gammaproteobacteria bacterium]|nr:lipid-A-disaccharide synthase [Gammaproteobacteria bacterium]
MKNNPPHIMLLAGEASGDQHGAEMALELLKSNPELKLTGMGSQEMKGAGVSVFFDSASIAVMGIVEIAKHWGDIKIAMKLVKQQLEETKPDLLVCIDYPEFNLKMANHAKSLGIKVLFYISPQVWAWRPKRVKKIGRRIDHMAVIFPFEVDFYQQHGIPVTYVGHPLVDTVPKALPLLDAQAEVNIPNKKITIGLFPGSRQSELERLLPTLLDSAELLAKQYQNEIQFVLPVAKTLDVKKIEESIKSSGVTVLLKEGHVHSVINSCDAIISCSGTVTLEIALLGVPLCVVYKMSWLSHQIMSRLMIIDHFSLVNIVAKQEIVKEMLQDQATPENIVKEVSRLINDKAYAQQVKKGLHDVKQRLGSGGGSKKVSQLALSLL